MEEMSAYGCKTWPGALRAAGRIKNGNNKKKGLTNSLQTGRGAPNFTFGINCTVPCGPSWKVNFWMSTLTLRSYSLVRAAACRMMGL